MKEGKIINYNNGVGKILSEGNTYNFNLNVVRADNDLNNDQDIIFDIDRYGNVTIIRGTGATKPTKAPVPKQKQKQNKKENITSSSPSKLVDNRDFLTEEK